ncbi:ERV/ALR sulfhydryl oxidase domain-containing protein [Limtongia smithiae]|uniref:ERV/ALR sulfhydryl oxidase domain-containing protein n=1 Tax=Limtongia smithiae TaxID=1125753 RepID=UPI0034CD91CB
MAKTALARRPLVTVIALIAAIVLFTLTLTPSRSREVDAYGRDGKARGSRPVILKASEDRTDSGNDSLDSVRMNSVHDIADASDYDPLQGPVPVSSQKLSQGGPIMPHLGNETIKAELGRASWKLLHTILARYPERPTAEEREALSSYIYLFSRVYPCGECAAHFQKLLKTFPPQTSSRIAASQWGCHVHNQVNARLGKDTFDCNTIAERYQCGCEDVSAAAVAAAAADTGGADAGAGDEGVSARTAGSASAADEFLKVEDKLRGIHIESKEGLTRGG